MSFLAPLVFSVGTTLFFAWWVTFPRKALNFQVKYLRFGVLYPPRKNTFYLVYTMVGGLVGMSFFGIASLFLLGSFLKAIVKP